MGKYKVWFILILCNLFWAGNYVLGKYVVAEITPLWITFTRWLIASLLLLLISHFAEKPRWSVVKSSWPMLAVMGLLGLVGYNMILYTALDYTSPVNASLINTLNPGIIVLFSVFLLREKISLVQISGILVSLTGVLVVLTRGNLGQVLKMQYNRGDLLMLAAITIWTIYSILGRRLKDVPPITSTAVSAVFATIIMAPFALYQGIDITRISPVASAGIVYIILFPSVGSFIFWNIGVREIGASKAGIFLNLMPVFTVIISWALGERITVVQICGGLLVFAGVYMATGALERRLSRNKIVASA